MQLKPFKDKKELYFLLGIFAFSFILRLIYLLQIKSNPFFDSPYMDPLYHDLWAQSIARGNWIGDQVFFRAPFYPYFLGIIYKIFGHNYFIPRLIQHLIGSFSVILVYLFAKRFFSKKVAYLSTVFASIYWIFFYFEGELLLDSFLIPFSLLLIIFLSKAAENPGKSYFIWAGVSAGLFAITRPNILIFIPFILLWIFLFLKLDLKKKLSFALLFLLGLFLLIFPITMRNYLVGRDFVLIASQGGINFYIGNNPVANGLSAVLPPYGDDWEYTDAVYEVKKAVGKTPKPSEVSDYYYKKGLDFILHSPEQFLSLYIKKLYFFWNSFEPSNNQDISFFRRYSILTRILPLSFWLISPLSLLGMALCLKNWKKLFLPLCFVFSYSLSVILFFINSRFRLPVLPFLLVFSAYALFRIFEYIQKSQFKKIALSLALFILFFFLANSNLYNLDKKNYAQAYYALGNLHLKKGEISKAEENYRLALENNPLAKRAHLNLGIIYFNQGNYPQAEKEFLEELKTYAQEEKAYNNLSALYRLQGEYSKAVEQAKNALEVKPYYVKAYINLFLAYLREGSFDSAESTLTAANNLYPPPAGMRFYSGLFYQMQGNPDKALEEYALLLKEEEKSSEMEYNVGLIYSQDDPGREGLRGLKAYAAYNSGVIHIQKKELDKAQNDMVLTLQQKPDFAEAHSALAHIHELRGEYQQAIKELQKALNLNPNNPVYHYNLGLVFARTDNLPLAREELQKALTLSPEFEPAREKLKLVDSLLSP
ncbi:MAG: tetratricopeptide repeat protein [candidate division Zixibacteria bacterium]|nr:tetratricopeptide repeat protein [candidate division Zixibacteria bacterium]